MHKSVGRADRARDIAASLTPTYPTRQVACPHCSHQFHAARRAISLRCPGCTGQIQLQDAVLTGIMAGNVFTLGNVRVSRRGSVHGKVDCGQFHVEGSFTGNVHVRGAAVIDTHAAVQGEISAVSLKVELGAQANCHISIGAQEDHRAGDGVAVNDHLGEWRAGAFEESDVS